MIEVSSDKSDRDKKPEKKKPLPLSYLGEPIARATVWDSQGRRKKVYGRDYL